MTNLTATDRTGDPQGQRPFRLLSIAGALTAVIAFSGCGAIAEKVTEEGAERIIESESGQDVELDLGGGDGNFSVKTEDGKFSVGENGEFSITDADGSVYKGSTDIDDDGGLVIEGADGAAVFKMLTEIPAEWPADIPRPDGLVVESGSLASSDGQTLLTVVGTPGGDAADYANEYGARVEAAGFSSSGEFEQSSDGTTSFQRTYENATWTVLVNGYTDAATNSVTVTITDT